MSKKQTEKPHAVEPSSGNIFEDLKLANPEKHLAKAELAMQVNQVIDDRGLKQIDAAAILGVDQPKVSALRCGRLDGFSIERLIIFLNKLDCDVDIIVHKKSSKRCDKHGRLRVAFA